ERFVVLFDGLNETGRPIEVFQHLNNFLNSNPYEWVKVIMTCRSFAWKTIENSGILQAKHRYVLSSDGSIAHTLQPFDDEELGQALKVYSHVFEASFPKLWTDARDQDYRERKILRSPLILRFVFEAFRGR